MKLSPLDIRKQSFDTALRGYSKEDVDAFLQMVSEQWEEMLDEQRRLEDQVESLEDKMDHYQQVEEALQEALQTARENSEQKLENARRKAELMIQEAEARGDEIKREAREDREVMRHQVDQLQERRDEVVARLRAFLMSEMELLMRFDDEDPDALREALPDHLAQHVSGEQPGGAEPSEAESPEAEPSGGEASTAGREEAPTRAGRPGTERSPKTGPVQAESSHAESHQFREEAPSGDAIEGVVSEEVVNRERAPDEEKTARPPGAQETQQPRRPADGEEPGNSEEPVEHAPSPDAPSPDASSPTEEGDETDHLMNFLEQFENAQPAPGASSEQEPSPQESPPADRRGDREDPQHP
ncbi:MAG: hypothetical protein BRD30_13735 [Bacteroidetes bacterium QH_2_63_10]|nr:MAG: hypothetical protein BRD30_13735 [Bacteroidetes bacterium QH_2_63_10]